MELDEGRRETGLLFGQETELSLLAIYAIRPLKITAFWQTIFVQLLQYSGQLKLRPTFG